MTEYKPDTIVDFPQDYLAHQFALASGGNRDASLVMLLVPNELPCDDLTRVSRELDHTQDWRQLTGHGLEGTLYALAIPFGGEDDAQRFKGILDKQVPISDPLARCEYAVFDGAQANAEHDTHYDAKKDSQRLFDDLLAKLRASD